jgi:hypothetical protein
MKRFVLEQQPVLHELTCDRCGVRHQRPGSDFFEFASIAYRAGYGSIFGDGNHVEIDLCQDCVQATMGPWLRILKDERSVRLRADVAGFDPDAHGDER